MALIGRLFKVCATLLIVIAAGFAAPAYSAEFSARRGINMDQWVTWPQEPTWGDPGVLQPFPEWRKFVSKADVVALKDAGFDFVRLPIDPAPFLSAKTGAIRDQLYGDVLETVRLINGAGLKVIVDLHLIGSMGDYPGMEQIINEPAALDAYTDVVRRMGQTIAREPADKVAFELMNEPGAGCDASGSAQWADIQSKLYAAARASATRLTLVLTGGCGSSTDGLVSVNPTRYPDDNLIWTFHSYDPFVLTHQGATWAGDFVKYVTGLPWPGQAVARPEWDAALEGVRNRIRNEAPMLRRAGMLSYFDEQMGLIDTPERLGAAMDQPFDRVSEWATRYGIKPENILLGEFGLIRKEYGQDYQAPAAARVAYYKAMIERAEKAGFMWSLWSYGGAFGVVQEFGGAKAEPDVINMIRTLP